MGAFAEAAIEEAMRCLVERDTRPPRAGRRDDSSSTSSRPRPNAGSVELIALRAPMADDLRDVVAALKIAGVVERIGDYAKNIARRVAAARGGRPIEPLSLLPEMAKIASRMVHNVLMAFVERDAEMARRSAPATTRSTISTRASSAPC